MTPTWPILPALLPGPTGDFFPLNLEVILVLFLKW